MSNIKQQYVSIIEFLQANQDKKVKTILPELIEQCGVQRTRNSDVTLYDGDMLIAVFCGYHKKWELVSEIEYGIKAGTKTGLNSLCKEGNKHQAAQSRKYSEEAAKLADAMMNGELSIEDAKEEKKKLEEAKVAVIEHSSGTTFSFDTKEEVFAALKLN